MGSKNSKASHNSGALRDNCLHFDHCCDILKSHKYDLCWCVNILHAKLFTSTSVLLHTFLCTQTCGEEHDIAPSV